MLWSNQLNKEDFMKLFLVLAALGSLVACSSTPKGTTETTQAPVAASTQKTEAVAPPSSSTKPVAEKSVTAPKTTPSAATDSGTTCKAGADERTLAINVKEAGCELVYTKMGETKTIASQIQGNEKCEEVFSKVKENLTKANFSCE
jgi:hypothetical protein